MSKFSAEELFDAVDRRTKDRTLGLQIILPLSFLIVFAVLPILVTFIWSFWPYENGQFIVSFTLDNYLSAFEYDRLQTILFTVRTAALTAIIAILLGFPISYFLAVRVKSDEIKLVVLLILVIPFVVNRVLKIFALRNILSSNGLVSQITGLDIPAWVLFSEFSMYVGFINDVLALAIFAIWLALERLQFEWIEASRDLGASKTLTFRKIVLPMSAPGIAAATILVFVIVMGDIAVPEMLGGLEVYSIGQMLRSIFEALRLSFAGAISLVTLLIVVSVFLIGQRYFNVLTIFEEAA